jgi:hypothetical protein
MAGGRSPREQIADSDALELGDSPFASDVPRVQRRSWFDQDDVNLFVSGGAVLDAARDDNEFAFLNGGFVAPELHPQYALYDQKHFVFALMMVPDKLALQFDGLDVAVVYFADDTRVAVVGKKGEFFVQIDCFHERTY